MVCEANICRSPMAQGLLVAALPEARVRSAGLNAVAGMPADPMAVHLMQERRIDIARHRALQVTRELCMEAELVLVMTANQRRRLEKIYPFACGRVFRICEFSNEEVLDPYHRPEQVFRQSLQQIDNGLREWLLRIEKLSEEHGP